MDRTGEGVQTDRAGRNGVGRRGTNPGSREKDGADRTAKLDEQRADRTAKPDEDARVLDRNAQRMSRATNARSTEDSRADVCGRVRRGGSSDGTETNVLHPKLAGSSGSVCAR